MPLADPVTHREMLEQCRRQNIDLAARRAWLDKVRAILAERLQDPPGLEELARRLNCSSRSLRRHLQQQRTSYQQLLDELRFARAKELLQSGDMPIYRIAEELGFSETASLRHAFQRWSGQPPSISAPGALAQAEGLVSAWRRRRSSATSPRDFAAPSPIQAMKARSKRKSAPHSPTRKRRTSWALR